jgi:hypothetical protein
MASTIERAVGRQRLIDVMCDPVTLMSAYNAVASDSQPKWSGSIITRLPVSRRK